MHYTAIFDLNSAKIFLKNKILKGAKYCHFWELNPRPSPVHRSIGDQNPKIVGSIPTLEAVSQKSRNFTGHFRVS